MPALLEPRDFPETIGTLAEAVIRAAAPALWSAVSRDQGSGTGGNGGLWVGSLHDRPPIRSVPNLYCSSSNLAAGGEQRTATT